MTAYWLLFLFPAIAAVLAVRASNVRRGSGGTWFLVWAVLVVIIGLRHEVGGDWGNYVENLNSMAGAPLEEVLQGKDFGYELLNWIGSEVGGGIYLVNTGCAVMFATGLVVFARAQPRPWLVLVVAIPYLVIVVAMGYTRQGAAIGLMMLGLTALARQHTAWFVVAMLAAALMHKSAIVMLPLAVLAVPKRRLWNAIWAGITIVAAYRVLVEDTVDIMVANYVETGYASEGAAVRVAMTAIPAAILLYERRRLVAPTAERNLWVLIALLSLGAAAWLPFAASSTAVDRLSLYFIPLQMYVFSRLPELVGRGAASSGAQPLVVAVILYYALVQFVWLNFAIHATGWLPYQSILFVD